MKHYPNPKPEHIERHLNAKREARLAKRRQAYQTKKRLEQIREALRIGNASYQDLADLADMRANISWQDVELLEPAGIPENVYNFVNTKYAKGTKSDYLVIVGNVGDLGTFTSKKDAVKCYLDYLDASNAPYGRASGESVTLMRNGEIVCKHLGTMEDQV
jgi:hypothetical protein